MVNKERKIYFPLFKSIKMRKRININAISSSDNYRASKKMHYEYLKEKEKPSTFSGLYISSDTSVIKD